MKFFIPHLTDDPAAAEAEWQRYLDAAGAPPDSRRIYRLTYEHDGDRYELTVGEPRQQFRRQTGPRGGYIRNADHERYGRATGTIVSGIIDAGTWSRCGRTARRSAGGPTRRSSGAVKSGTPSTSTTRPHRRTASYALQP